MFRGKLLIGTVKFSNNNIMNNVPIIFLYNRDEVPDAEKTGCLLLGEQNIWVRHRLEETTNCDWDTITTA